MGGPRRRADARVNGQAGGEPASDEGLLAQWDSEYGLAGLRRRRALCTELRTALSPGCSLWHRPHNPVGDPRRRPSDANSEPISSIANLVLLTGPLRCHLVIAVLPTFTFPLDHEQHRRTDDAGSSPSIPQVDDRASRPHDPVVTGTTPGLLYRALTGSPQPSPKLSSIAMQFAGAVLPGTHPLSPLLRS